MPAQMTDWWLGLPRVSFCVTFSCLTRFLTSCSHSSVLIGYGRTFKQQMWLLSRIIYATYLVLILMHVGKSEYVI